MPLPLSLFLTCTCSHRALNKLSYTESKAGHTPHKSTATFNLHYHATLISFFSLLPRTEVPSQAVQLFYCWWLRLIRSPSRAILWLLVLTIHSPLPPFRLHQSLSKSTGFVTTYLMEFIYAVRRGLIYLILCTWWGETQFRHLRFDTTWCLHAPTVLCLTTQTAVNVIVLTR